MAQKPPKGMHREEIKAALRMQRGPITLLSESWGLNRSAITQTLHDPSASTRVERLIADALGMRVQDIWPERWDERGTPLPRSPKTKPSRNDPAHHRQNREAA